MGEEVQPSSSSMASVQSPQTHLDPLKLSGDNVDATQHTYCITGSVSSALRKLLDTTTLVGWTSTAYSDSGHHLVLVKTIPGYQTPPPTLKYSYPINIKVQVAGGISTNMIFHVTRRRRAKARPKI
uniref:Uncharacterized protein n=2 Tax=Oryza TaxID=4527 RepID=A0A0E0GFQ9_ORYNI